MTTNVTQKLYTDGRIEDVEIKMSLEQLQQFVGGYIEMVPTKNPRRSLVVNEEGMLNDLPPNENATKLAHPNTLIMDFIRGDALLVKS